LLAISRGAEGGMRDALSSLDQLIAFKGGNITEEDALSVFGLVSRSELEGLAGAILRGDDASILKAVANFDSAGKNMRRLAGELMVHFRNLVVWQALGTRAGDTLEITSDQRKTLEEQARICDSSRIFRIADKLAEMEDKLRYVLSVRTMIEMTLLRAGRIASVASIEELMKAVRDLKANGGLPQSQSASPAAKERSVKTDSSKTPAETPQSEKSAVENVEKKEVSSFDRQAILDDPKLNGILQSMPGTKVVDIK
jgi:DNA polymerase-3 subunit gamma/tau